MGDRFEWIDSDSQNLFRFTFNISSKSWQAKCLLHEPERAAAGGLTHCTRSRRAPNQEQYEDAIEELKQWCRLAPTVGTKEEHQALPRPRRRGRGPRGQAEANGGLAASGAPIRRGPRRGQAEATGGLAASSSAHPPPLREAEDAENQAGTGSAEGADQPDSSSSSSTSTSSSTGEDSGNSSDSSS